MISAQTHWSAGKGYFKHPLESVVKKRPKKRNAVAKALEAPIFRQRVVPDKREKDRQKQINADIRSAIVKNTDKR